MDTGISSAAGTSGPEVIGCFRRTQAAIGSLHDTPVGVSSPASGAADGGISIVDMLCATAIGITDTWPVRGRPIELPCNVDRASEAAPIVIPVHRTGANAADDADQAVDHLGRRGSPRRLFPVVPQPIAECTGSSIPSRHR